MKKKRSILLWVGYRKEGDKNDAYEEMRRRMKNGDFDVHFEELGIKKP